MPDFSKILSANLRGARGNRSQAEFARILGIKHQQTYHNYEAGQPPKGDVLLQIARRLGTTCEKLLTMEMDDEPPYLGAPSQPQMVKEEGRLQYASPSQSPREQYAPRSTIKLRQTTDTELQSMVDEFLGVLRSKPEDDPSRALTAWIVMDLLNEIADRSLRMTETLEGEKGES